MGLLYDGFECLEAETMLRPQVIPDLESDAGSETEE